MFQGPVVVFICGWHVPCFRVLWLYLFVGDMSHVSGSCGCIYLWVTCPMFQGPVVVFICGWHVPCFRVLWLYLFVGDMSHVSGSCGC